MEILSEKNQLKCFKHPNEQSIFIKINQISTFDKIIYCEKCIEEDITFRPLNFLRIKKISESKLFIQQLPPFDDNKIHEQILQIQSNVENDKNDEILQANIINFFDELKKEIISKVDICQKSMIKHAAEISYEKKNILEKFKEISNIDNLKSILTNNNINEREREDELRQFIQSVMNKKEQSKQQLSKVLNENNYQNRQYSFDALQEKKLEIISLIESLNFFEEQKMDLIKSIYEKNKIEDILPQLNILQSSAKHNLTSKIKILSLQDNQIEINSKTFGGERLYSNIILEENKKYVFKFKFHTNSFQDQYLNIGLINDLYKDSQDLEQKQVFYSRLEFQKSSQQVKIEEEDFMLKGQVDMDDVRDIELRIDLYNEMVDIIFSNQSSLSLKPEFKNYLKTATYRLYLFLNNQISATITSAVICDKFED